MLANQIQAIIALLVLTLAVAFLARWLRLPYTLVLVVAGLVLGLLRILPGLRLEPDVVLYIFLPALLFEGAWSMDLQRLREHWLPVVLLAVPGLVLSVLVVGICAHFGAGLDWPIALLLGAIVSPTDTVAVLTLFRQLGVTPDLRTIIEGESLINDGVGAAAFVILLELVPGGTTSHLSAGALTLVGLWELVGGPLLGLAVGWLIGQALRLVDDHLIETTVTFSVAYGVYLLANALHTSGLLAVVVAGMVIAALGRRFAFSERTLDVVDDVWEFTGYVANSLLFLLLGMEIGAAQFIATLPAIIWTVLGVFLGRAAMVYGLLAAHDALAQRLTGHHWRGPLPAPQTPIPPRWRPLLLFSGLRGALSLALVLSLSPAIKAQPILIEVVYGVVLVTLLGQGIGLRLVLPRLMPQPRT